MAVDRVGKVVSVQEVEYRHAALALDVFTAFTHWEVMVSPLFAVCVRFVILAA